VTACQNSGRSVAVVSNNSAAAVHSYLARHGLDDRIGLVVARTNHDPALLKPNPHLVAEAVNALNAEPGECTLVGDSVSDIEGARLANVQSIGYANKAGKRERLGSAGAGAIINSLADLALRLRARVVDPELLQLPPRISRAHLRRARPTSPRPRLAKDAQDEHGERERAGSSAPRRPGVGGDSRRRWRAAWLTSSCAIAHRRGPPPARRCPAPGRSPHPAVTDRGSCAPRAGRVGRHAPGAPIAG
jgi:hypothetical protein